MANGENPSSESEEYVLRSAVRAGLNREFVFALNAQAQLPASLCRTRSGKSTSASLPVTAAASRSREGKRQKKSGAGDPKAAAAVSDASSLSPGFNLVESEAPVVLNSEVSDLKRLEDSNAEPRNGVNTDLPSVVEGHGASVSTKKPIKVFVRSPVRGRMSGKVPPIVSPSEYGIKTLDSTIGNEGERRLSSDSFENGPAVEDGMVIYGSSRLSAGGITLEIPEYRNARLIGGDAFEAETGNTSPTAMTRATPPLADPPSSMVDNVDGQQIRNGLPDKSSMRFAVSILTGSPSMQGEGPAIDNSPKEHNHDGNEGDSCLLGKSVRRFTRSTLKSKVEESGLEEGSSTMSEASGSEETSAVCSANGSFISSPNRRMELKMSKKIAVTKLPRNVKELISTGLLEGLPVKYVPLSGRQTELHGVIKGNGILCSCSSCDGSTVVSAYVFEQHAGSTKKHPSDFIYLENGSNLHDVVNACTSVPLDMLEAAIEGAIAPRPVKTSFTCKRCNDSFLGPSSGKFTFVCDKCLDIKQLQTTPSPLNYNVTSSRLSRASSTPCSSDISSKNASLNKKTSSGKITRKDLSLHKLVFKDGVLPEGTAMSYFVRGEKLLEGYKEGSGIHCQCCDKVVSPSQFEAHAGEVARRKPYNNIYISNGVSLHELSVSLSQNQMVSPSKKDNLCGICTFGGKLLKCNLCPRAFHKECLGFQSVPEGTWCCHYCVSMLQREKCLASNNNAIAAGRVQGGNPIVDIIERRIHIIMKQEVDDGCVLCRIHDFTQSGFDDHTVIICDQCEKEYHIGCLRDHNMADLKELPPGEWFCCTDCSRIKNSLEEFVLCGYQPLPSLDTDNINRKCVEKGVATSDLCDIRWRIIRGISASEDMKLLLSEAIEIFHESFKPMEEGSDSECNLISCMVRGAAVKDQDYRGMHVAILSAGPAIVSAAVFRILGSSVAELPLVATRTERQGLGYFQALFSCIERLLGSLNVKHFLLPAAKEAESLWIKCGFSRITNDELQNYLNGVRVMTFSETAVLHKLVPPPPIQYQGEENAIEQ